LTLDNNFTILKDDRINRKIQVDLEKIRASLLNEFGEIEALILVGGFGRGEGSVLVENGRIKPINDYDIVMITRKLEDKKKINILRKKLAEDIGLWWVDITNYKLSKVSRLKYSMYNYDLKYGSYVFYGRERILDLIPQMDPKRMPLIEGEMLFFTRMWCFLGPFKTEFLERDLDSKERFFLMNQMSKAIGAFCDAMIITKGCYHHSYAKRLERFKELYFNRRELVELAELGTEFKLTPYTNISIDLIGLYFRVKVAFLEQMSAFVSRMYGRQFSNWHDYTNAYSRIFKNLLKRGAFIVFDRNNRFGNKILVNIAQLFLVAALERNSVNGEFLKAAVHNVSRITREDLSSLSWDEARALVADLRMRF